jgi:uroporphyrinogen-III synthase
MTEPPTAHVARSDDQTLHGCTVVVTRERAGELGRLLAAAGADVVHVPLIEVADSDEVDLQALSDALEQRPDWIAVTSPAGAERVARHIADTPQPATANQVRYAAVGTATAQRLEQLTGRRVDLVPERQLAVELAASFNAANPQPQRIVVAQADRAGTVLADGLRQGGHDVTVVTAYRTIIRRPSEAEVMRIAAADAITFASGSAATSWADALGERASRLLPPLVVAIGPSTAEAAHKSGLKVTYVSSDHSLAGLINTLTTAWHQRESE